MSRRIKVTGRAKAYFPPDKITLTLTIEAADKEYQKTLDTATEKLEGVQRALAAVGFEKEELKTAAFNVSDEYEYFQTEKNGNERQLVGYSCTHRLRLEFDMDMERLGKVLEALSQCEANAEFHIIFGVKDIDSLEKQLMAQAVKDANEKAEILAKAAGVKLKEITAISSGDFNDNIVSPTYFEQGVSVLRAVPVDITPESVDGNISVNVEWEIE